MSLDKQIVSIIAFFILGISVYLDYIFFTKGSVIKTYLNIIIITFLFILILYHLTNGIIHPYFIIIYLLGILSSKICVKKLKFIILKLKNRK